MIRVFPCVGILSDQSLVFIALFALNTGWIEVVRPALEFLLLELIGKEWNCLFQPSAQVATTCCRFACATPAFGWIEQRRPAV
ncbi:hypothetical protein A4R89_14900 (plasmid) [Acetobacter ascendens]|nr:hypothetical protein A4R89_14900 [Acetobacter ascendens]